MLKGFGKKKFEASTKDELITLCKGCGIYDSYMKDLDKKDLIKELMFYKISQKQPKKKIPKALKDACWKTYIGISIAQTDCPMKFCGNKISQMSFDVGHVIAEARGGKTEISNLRPICHDCNISMGTENMEDFKKYFNIQKKEIAKPQVQTQQKVTQKKCCHIFVKGKNKGKKCEKDATEGDYCNKHQPKDTKNGCQFTLTSGKNKGEKCGKSIFEKQYCKIHADKIEISDSSDEEEEDIFKERLDDLKARMIQISKNTSNIKQRINLLTVVSLRFIISDLYNYTICNTLKDGLVEECIWTVNNEKLDEDIEKKLDPQFKTLFFDFFGIKQQNKIQVNGNILTINLDGVDQITKIRIISFLQKELLI